MNNKFLSLGILSLAVLTAGTFGVNQALAGNGQVGGYNNANNMGQHRNVTEADKAAWQIKMDAVTKAIETNDYNAWVVAKKAIDSNCPILSQINATNFPKYAEAYKLKIQSDKMMTDLGIERGSNRGMGMGRGRGMMNNIQ